MVQEFFDHDGVSDHDRFQEWREDNQDGVVISMKTASRGNLHGTCCSHFGNAPYFTSKDSDASLTAKRKICGTESEVLEWAAKAGVTVTRCFHCHRDDLIE